MKDVEAKEIKSEWPSDQRAISFIGQLLGFETEAAFSEQFSISSGIDLLFTDVIINPAGVDPEEMSYLNFYPVATDTHYLQLSFLPEYSNIVSDAYRIVQLIFNPAFFQQWPVSLFESYPSFRLERNMEQAFTLNNDAKELLDQLLKAHKTIGNDLVSFLRRQEFAIQLLRYALEAFLFPDEANKLPACGFLNNNTERDKILQTQKIILSHLENPLTIRALSREVGMNECYLKKGFKAIFGKTIHEYQQAERIAKAKVLLATEKYSINEVAFMMGFGSPSHFSTSFKKITGMKPCELLR